MRIDNVQIDAYGEKEGLTLDYSLGNFQLTYGANEAGKSTTLSFIRNMLFDLAPKANVDVDPLYGRRSEVGGVLAFTLADGQGGRVLRRWDCRESKQIEFDGRIETKVLTNEEFVQRVLGCDRDFFTNHFGFSSLELSRGGSALERSEIARFLFGASIGDFDRVETLQKNLEERVKKLYAKKAGAKNPLIDAAVARITNASQQIAATANKSSSYRAKLDEYDRLKKETEQTTAQRNAAAQESARLKKLADAREKYVEYRQTIDQLATRRARARFEAAERFSEADEKSCEENDAKTRELQNSVALLKDDLAARVRDIDALDVASINATCDKAKEINQVDRCLKEYKKKVAERPKTIEELDDKRRELLSELDVFYSRSEEDTDDEALARARDEAPSALIVEEIERRAKEDEEIVRELRNAESSVGSYEKRVKDAQTALEARARELADAFGDEDRSVERKSVDDAKALFPSIRESIEGLSALVLDYEASEAKERAVARELAIQANDGAEPTEDFAEFLGRIVEPAQFESLKEKRDELVESRVETERALAAIDAEIESLNVGDSDVVVRYKASERDFARLIEELQTKWRAVQDALLDSAPVESSRRGELATEFSETLGAIERVAKAFGASSKELGEYEFRDARFKFKMAARNSALESLKALDAELRALDATARETRLKFGFEKRVDWDFETTARWIEKWRIWREVAAETAAKRREVTERARRRAVDLSNVFVYFLSWTEFEKSKSELFRLFYDDSDASPRELLDALSEIFKYADEVRRNVEVAADRYDSLKHARDVAAYKVKEAEEAVERCANELAQAREARKSHRALLAGFCEENRLRFSAEAELAWPVLLKAAQRWNKWREEFEKYEREVERLSRDDAFIAEYDAAVTSLVESVFGRGSNGVEFDAQALVDALNAALTDKGRYENASKQRDATNKRLKEKEGELATLLTEARTRRESLGIESEEDFSAFRDEAREFRTLTTRLKEARGLLETALGVSADSNDWRLFFAEWESNDELTINARLSEATTRAAELDVRFAEENRRLGELGNELKTMRENEGNVALLAERRENVAALRGYVDEYVPLRLAQIALEKSVQRFQDERIPSILSAAQELFSRVTEGRYVEIRTLETKDKGTEYVVYDEHRAGKLVPELSSGTREQLYLALKLALIREYAENSEPLPILIDDALVNSDDKRARQIMKVLDEFATERQQIVLFSHSLSTRDAFAEIVGEDKIVELKGARE